MADIARLQAAIRCINNELCENRNDCLKYGCVYAGSEDCMFDIIRDAGEAIEGQSQLINELDRRLNESRPVQTETVKTTEVRKREPEWAGRTVLVRGVPVHLQQEIISCDEEPYAAGHDDHANYYKIPLDSITPLLQPISGIYEPKKGVKKA